MTKVWTLWMLTLVRQSTTSEWSVLSQPSRHTRRNLQTTGQLRLSKTALPASLSTLMSFRSVLPPSRFQRAQSTTVSLWTTQTFQMSLRLIWLMSALTPSSQMERCELSTQSGSTTSKTLSRSSVERLRSKTFAPETLSEQSATPVNSGRSLLFVVESSSVSKSSSVLSLSRTLRASSDVSTGTRTHSWMRSVGQRTVLT